jgi:hypothetical protein
MLCMPAEAYSEAQPVEGRWVRATADLLMFACPSACIPVLSEVPCICMLACQGRTCTACAPVMCSHRAWHGKRCTFRCWLRMPAAALDTARTKPAA